jgi:hypothetical protein
MPFAPEWLYLDELLNLLDPSPDMVDVEATFRGALDEDALQDRDGTPRGGWRRRFQTGEVLIDWRTGVVLIPWFNRRLQEWEVRPIRPQFRRADWLALFDKKPATTAEPASNEQAQMEQKAIQWFREECPPFADLKSEEREARQVEAVTHEFPQLKGVRTLIRKNRPKGRPGARPRRKSPAPIPAKK